MIHWEGSPTTAPTFLAAVPWHSCWNFTAILRLLALQWPTVYLDQGSVQRDQEQGHPSHNEHTQHQTLASKHHSPLTGTLDNWLIQTWSRKSKMTQDRTSHVPDTKEEIQRWQGPVKRTQGPAQSRSPWWMSSKTEKDSDKWPPAERNETTIHAPKWCQINYRNEWREAKFCLVT